MKPTVLFLTVLGCVTAIPNGYYHQEYNYKSSSSAYKNNELQHKTDDQGYYRKDGDLEGRVRPKVDANSEHSEYVNPNLRNSDYNTGYNGGSTNGDLSSYGHLSATSGTYGTHGLSSEGLASSNHIAGSAASGAYSGYSSGSYGSSNTYGVSSNLRSVTSQIQQELERDLQRAIQDNRAYSQSSISVNDLEREIRHNITNRLNNELSNRYGQQGVRGGLSYSILDGRLQSTANYDNQELQDLKRQLENALLTQLRSQYHQSSSSHYQTQQQTSHGSYGYTTTVRPVYYVPSQAPYRPNTHRYIQYTPVSHPESITTLATRVQGQLDSRLNELLEDVQRRYFSSSSSYSLTNFDVVLENLRNELRNNITFLLNEKVKANYGNQIPRDGHMYSVSSDGQTSNQYNYSIQDLENLRSQIERNLIDKLNRDFETHRSRWYQQSQSQSSHSSGAIQYGTYSTPRYDSYSTPRYDSYSTPLYAYNSDVEHFTPRPAHIGVKGSSSNRRFNLLAGSSHGGYEISGQSGNIAQLQSQLQQDLSRQLQAALSRSHSGSYSLSGAYNPQSYQTSYQQLSDELSRNLTRQLQEYSSSGYYSTYGNFDQSQMESLRNQLQANLLRQLQQGLQQSYQSSSSYSASSSSSSGSGSYRPVRGFDNYQSGQYRSGVIDMNGADCVGDDPNAYVNHRMKRSYQPYRSQALGISTSSNYRGYNPRYDYSSSGRLQYGTNQPQEFGQQVDESDLTQQVQEPHLERFQQGSQQQLGLGQQVDDSELTQQVEDSGIGKLELGSQNQQLQLGQNVDDSELSQQVEDSGTGQLRLSSQNQHLELGQQVDDSDLTQQVQNSGIGRLQLGSQSQRQVELGQEVDDTELTQQVENSGIGRLQIGSQSYPQLQNPGTGRLQLGSQSQRQIELGQQVDDTELTQQVENSGRIQLGSQSHLRGQLGQHSGDSELTQQIQDSRTGRLELGSPSQQQAENSQLTQQVQDSDFGRLGYQSQTSAGLQEDNSGLTQKVEDVNFGGLHLVSQNQQIDQNPQMTESEVEDVNNGKLQKQQNVDRFDGTQQIEVSGLGKLQQPVQVEQDVDNLDLTQQVEQQSGLTQEEDENYGTLRLNSQSHQQYANPQNSNIDQNSAARQHQMESTESLQQTEDFGRLSPQGQYQTSFGIQTGNRPVYQDSNFNQIQKQVAQQLENELSRQLTEAVKNYYLSYSDSNSQATYLHLLRELERNLTEQLQNVVPSSGSRRYTYSYVFRGPQIDSLKKELENVLKLQLRQEISTVRDNGPIRDLESEGIQQSSDSQQQEENKFGSLELGVHSSYDRYGHLHQNFGNNQINQQISDVNRGQEIEQVSPIEQTQQIGTQISDQQQNIENENLPLTQSQSDTNQPDRYAFRRPHSSSHLQFRNRPINRRPVDNTHFINTEINQQENLYPKQEVINQQSNQDYKPVSPNLSVSNGDEANTEHIIEPLSPQSGQQENLEFTDGQQQQNTDFSPQTSGRGDITESNLRFRPTQSLSLSQTQDSSNLNTHNEEASQGQLQSRADAERDADLLLDTLRESLQNRDRTEYGSSNTKPLSYAQVVSKDSQQQQPQTIFTNQNQDSFRFEYLSKGQIQLAHQLEHQLSTLLEDAVSQNHYLSQSISTNAGQQVSYKVNFEQFLTDLRRNITNKVDEIFGYQQSGYFGNSNYLNKLTQEQKEKLISELTQKLGQNFQASYEFQQSSGQNTFNPRVTSTSSLHASSASGSDLTEQFNSYDTPQIHYGQQNTLQDSELTSALHPVQPENPTVVQNVQPRPTYTGVKGSRGRVSSIPASSFSPEPEVQPPQAELITPVGVGAGSQAQEVPDLNKTPEPEEPESLPWWKRVGNKIRSGASSLKEKIIG